MSPLGSLTATALPSGPAYTVVLICHVAAALVGMITMVAGIAAALRLLVVRDGSVPASVRSYFSPGTSWAGRVLYLVPVFGGVLLGLSGGAYDLGSDWVLTGIGLWLVGIVLAELVLWPSEQRVRRGLVLVAAGGGTEAPPLSEDVRRAARTLCLSSIAVLAVLVAAMVVMFAKP